MGGGGGKGGGDCLEMREFLSLILFPVFLQISLCRLPELGLRQGIEEFSIKTKTKIKNIKCAAFFFSFLNSLYRSHLPTESSG